MENVSCRIIKLSLLHLNPGETENISFMTHVIQIAFKIPEIVHMQSLYQPELPYLVPL